HSPSDSCRAQARESSWRCSCSTASTSVILASRTGHGLIMKVFPEASQTPRWKAMSLATRTLASSRNSSPGINITDVASVKEFFNQAGSFDAIIATLGSAPFVHLEYADTEDFQAGQTTSCRARSTLCCTG